MITRSKKNCATARLHLARFAWFPQLVRLEWQNHLVLSFGIHVRTPQVFPFFRSKTAHGIYYALLRGLGWQVSYAWAALQPRARRDQIINPNSALSELPRPDNLVKKNASAVNKWVKAHYKKAGHEFLLKIPVV
jgi:hypothetical protein